MIYDCIIIGAGASGLFCAASMPRPVSGLILEKTGRPGTKLLMSGSGHCNVTHSGSIKDFLKCYGENGTKIRKCLYSHNNRELISFLESMGVKTIVREDGKVFPASMSAKDILEALLDASRKNGFTIEYERPASHMKKIPGGWSVRAGNSTFTGKCLIIASGGCSYPSTGSDGSMFPVMERDLDLRHTQLKPALVPVKVASYPYGELSGISFANACVSIWENEKRLAMETGGLLLTHGDLSGPAVLNISKYASPGRILVINYLHPADFRHVLDRLNSAVKGNSSDITNIAAEEFSLPKRFCRMMTERCGPSLKKLAALLTGDTFEISSTEGFGRAMTTCGGIELSQIDTSSMEAKGLPGLMIIGEALDIDAVTGGYSLQFAYSSACAACDSVMKKLDP